MLACDLVAQQQIVILLTATTMYTSTHVTSLQLVSNSDIHVPQSTRTTVGKNACGKDCEAQEDEGEHLEEGHEG